MTVVRYVLVALKPGVPIDEFERFEREVDYVKAAQNPSIVSYRTHRIDELPAPRPAKALPHREVRLLVIERDGALLFERRPASGIWGGLWSMPECAMEEDVGVVVRSKFGATVEISETMPPVEHGFTHYTLTMHPVRCEVSAWPASVGEAQIAWLAPNDALRAGLPAPIRKMVLGLQALQVRG